ncbi:MAG: hypothetical protein JW834_04505 [Candidatus Diapherotrites archaeon]|nr:hypothetical protein [Candidatus Diapherotrites archaeon]
MAPKPSHEKLFRNTLDHHKELARKLFLETCDLQYRIKEAESVIAPLSAAPQPDSIEAEREHQRRLVRFESELRTLNNNLRQKSSELRFYPQIIHDKPAHGEKTKDVPHIQFGENGFQLALVKDKMYVIARKPQPGQKLADFVEGFVREVTPEAIDYAQSGDRLDLHSGNIDEFAKKCTPVPVKRLSNILSFEFSGEEGKKRADQKELHSIGNHAAWALDEGNLFAIPAGEEGIKQFVGDVFSDWFRARKRLSKAFPKLDPENLSPENYAGGLTYVPQLRQFGDRRVQALVKLLLNAQKK